MNPKTERERASPWMTAMRRLLRLRVRRDPPLVRRGFLVEPSKRMRRSVAGRRRWMKRRPLLRPRRWSRWRDGGSGESRRRSRASGRAERQRGGKSMIPATKPTLMKTKKRGRQPSETRGHPGCNQDAESYAAYGPNPRWEVVDDGGDPSRPHSGGLSS
ncbi:unnamed protein product [Microthlaspi erraticum]|uniref:PH domain-containing protein n=1 Tax=Microthlaspi erraticum TaxID=1685480 RepID=A0A6D2KBX3_9BRAS|nr:unnamed protein product [Microthlaspi erraticum]